MALNYPLMIHKALTQIAKEGNSKKFPRSKVLSQLSYHTGLTEKKILKWMQTLSANDIIKLDMAHITLLKEWKEK